VLDREWVTVIDGDDNHLHYTFDVSFLTSNYACIYGDGCPGIEPEGSAPDKACCVHGAYLTEDEEASEIEAKLELLDPSVMQFHELATEKGVWVTDEDGDLHTRLVDGACIFANRTQFAEDNNDPRMMGCALHHLADKLGDHHMTHKPVVCWQVPLHRTVEEKVANDGEPLEVHTIAAYERGTWGEGGADFDWWCTEEPAAFTGREPVYRSMEFELREMVGDVVYEELQTFLDGRRRQKNVVRFLPMV
jgi:hypothetical protein